MQSNCSTSGCFLNRSMPLRKLQESHQESGHYHRCRRLDCCWLCRRSQMASKRKSCGPCSISRANLSINASISLCVNLLLLLPSRQHISIYELASGTLSIARLFFPLSTSDARCRTPRRTARRAVPTDATTLIGVYTALHTLSNSSRWE